MKVMNNIEMIDLGLYFEGNLIFSDFHIGFEEALNKQGILVPRFQFKSIIDRLDKIFLKLKDKKIDKIIINGDIKHEFGTISEQEWRHTLRLLDYLLKKCDEVILIKGNHDTVLGPIADKRKVKVLDYYLISNKKIPLKKSMKIKNFQAFNKLNTLKKISINKKTNKNNLIKIKNKIKKNILVIHGDKIPKGDLLKNSDVIIIGHEHPAVSIKEGPRVELFKCFLTGRYEDKTLIVQPSFNLVTEGTDLMKEKLLSPFLHQNLDYFEVFVVADKVYGFGRLNDLR